jgi:hypothetical protein
MGKTVVDSEIIKGSIQELKGREPMQILHRGSSSGHTYEVWWSNTEHEYVSIPVEILARHREVAREKRLARKRNQLENQ